MNSDIEYREDDVGTIRKSMSDPMAAKFADQIDPNSNETRRQPRPDVSLFPNQHLEHVEHGIVEAMKSAGIDPAVIYAFQHTGLMITEENQHLISDADMVRWQSAIDTHRQKEASNGLCKSATPDEWFCEICDRKLPKDAVRCVHCDAKVEDAPNAEDAEMLIELLGDMDPSLMDELRRMASDAETGDDFVDQLMVGPCPNCDSDNTGDCENDPAINDPFVAQCSECNQLFCCDCDDLFVDKEAAAQHNCPLWEDADF